MEKQYVTDINAVEARALACLMEKQLATPDHYPLTQNSLLLACNQKTNRVPVMALKLGELVQALSALSEKGWAGLNMGSRTQRYQQKASFKLHLTKAEQAVLCILMLRGPQTLNDLLARTARLLNNENDLLEGLDSLMQREQPLAEQLPRQSGQREDRFGHLFYEQEEILTSSVSTHTVKIDNPDAERIDQLEQDVAELKELVQMLMSKLNKP